MTDLPRNRMRARGRTHLAVCALAGAVALSTGCATSMNSSMQRVAVASDPPGAQVFIDDEAVGVTPAYLELDRRDGDLALRFEKDCYQETVLPVPRRTSKWVVGNALFAGIPVNEYTWGPWLGAIAFYSVLGGVLDRNSGGAFTFPDLVRASLERLPDTDREEEPGSGVEPDGGCAADAAGMGDEGRISGEKQAWADGGAWAAPGAAAESVDQGNTPSDR